MGCCEEDRQIIGDRQLPQVVGDREREYAPVNQVLSLIVNHSATFAEFFGAYTRHCYGLFKNGQLIQLTREDFNADRRVVKANQDTMRLYS